MTEVPECIEHDWEYQADIRIGNADPSHLYKCTMCNTTELCFTKKKNAKKPFINFNVGDSHEQ